MRAWLILIPLLLLVGCSESPEVRAKRYQPQHIKNGVYQFDLLSWPYSLAEFEDRYGDTLEVVTFGPVYNHDGTKVTGMVVLTKPKEVAR